MAKDSLLVAPAVLASMYTYPFHELILVYWHETLRYDMVMAYMSWCVIRI